MELTDHLIASTLLQVGGAGMVSFSSLVAISISTYGTLLVPGVFLFYPYFLLCKYYMRTSTELQRLENVSQSPIFSSFTEALVGLDVIKAFDQQDKFICTCEAYIDVNNVCVVVQAMAENWLNLRLSLMSGMISFTVAAAAILSDGALIPAGFVGLGLAGTYWFGCCLISSLFKFSMN